MNEAIATMQFNKVNVQIFRSGAELGAAAAMQAGTVITEAKSKSTEVFKKASDSVVGTKDQITQKLQELAGQSTKVMVDDVESATSG